MGFPAGGRSLLGGAAVSAAARAAGSGLAVDWSPSRCWADPAGWDDSAADSRRCAARAAGCD